jgi:hypothetical protein
MTKELSQALGRLPKVAPHKFLDTTYFYNYPIGSQAGPMFNCAHGWKLVGWNYASNVRIGTQPFVCMFQKDECSIWAHTSTERILQYAEQAMKRVLSQT